MVETPAAPKQPDFLPRLRILIIRLYQNATNHADRQKFSNLLDLLLRSTRVQEWAMNADAEKATHGSQTAIIYAALVHAIRMIHDKDRAEDIEDAVKFVEWAATASPGTFTIVGQQGVRFEMKPIK